MSGITVRADRLALSPMTPVVARSEAIVVVRAPPPGGVLQRLVDLDRPERRIGVNRGGHLERLTRTHLPRSTIVAIDDNQQLPRLLAAAEVDAIVTDTLELAAWGRDHIGGGGAGRFVVAHSLSRDRKGYWIAPHGEAVAADLTTWLLAREQDGFLHELRHRHFGSSPVASLPPEVGWLCELVVRRLALMPLVAEVKRRTGHDVEDRAREAAVTAAAARDARTVGLDPAATVVLVRAEMAAAKAAQRAARPSHDPAERGHHDHGGRTCSAAGRPSDDTRGARAAPEQHQMTLADLRAAIDRLDRAILRQLARVAPVRVQAEALFSALQADLGVPGVDRTALRGIADAITAMPRALPPEADSLAPISRAVATPWARGTATPGPLCGIPIGVGGFLY